MLIAFSLLSSCKNDTLTVYNPLDTQTEILPMRIGNLWTYKRIDYDSLGKVSKISTDSMKVDQRVSLECNLLGYHLAEYRNGQIYRSAKAYNNLEGFWEEGFINVCLLYSYPDTAGRVIHNCDIQQKILSINDIVVVPAGKFVCYKYSIEIQDRNTFQILWLSPGKGIIRNEEYRKLGNGGQMLLYRQDLTSLRIY